MELKPTEIRPKLKRDSVFIQLDTGALLETDDGTYFLKGQSVYRWISTLAPFLDGKTTLQEICEGLAPEQQTLVTNLVDMLLARRIVKNCPAESEELLPEAVRHRFESQIEFIDHFADRPWERFRAFRKTRILARGSGEAFTSLCITLLDNGLEVLHIAPDDQPDRYLRALSPTLEALRQRGVDATVRVVELGALFDELEHPDVVVYCTDNTSLREVYDLHRACWKARRPFLPAITFNGHNLIGPWVVPGKGPCWVCALLRYAANLEGDAAAALWQSVLLGDVFGGDGKPLYPVLARMRGAGIAFELYKILSGHLLSGADRGVIFQDVETLEAWRRWLLPHPLCPICSSSAPETVDSQLMQVVEQQDAPGARDRVERFRALINDSIGLYRPLPSENGQSSPLKVARLAIAAAGEMEATAFGLGTVQEARDRAFTFAVAHYAQALPDTRGMRRACVQQMAAAGLDAVEPKELSTWTGSCTFDPDCEIEWLPAYSPLTGRVRYVPAAAVYPRSGLNQMRVFEPHAIGAAAGTFQETLERGARNVLAYEQIRAAVRGHGELQVLDPTSLADDTHVVYLLERAGQFGQAVDLLRVTAGGPVPVVVARAVDDTGHEEFTLGAGWSEVEAAQEALLELVGRLQLRDAGENLREARDPMPELWLDVEPVKANADARAFDTDKVDLDRVSAYLRDCGQDILFVNTTPSDLMKEANGLVSGTVLLTAAVHAL